MAFGLALNATIADQPWVQTWLLDGLFYVVGEAFVGFLSMLIVPIVFVSLVVGVASLSDPKSLVRISVMVFWLYMLTTGIAVILALSAAYFACPL